MDTADVAWIESRLAERGETLVQTPMAHRIQPWSVVHRCETDHGTRWFKRVLSVARHEPALSALLAGRFPGTSAPCLAHDTVGRRVLLGDIGFPLRERLPEAEPLWAEGLAIHARQQRALVDATNEWDRLQVPDRRSPAIARALRSLVAPDSRSFDGVWHPVLPPDLIERSLRIADRLERPTGLPDTLVHHDLHDANLFVEGATVRVADWGECGIGHPWAVLTVALRAACHRWQTSRDDPRVARLRDTYLDCWSGDYDPGDRERLLRDADLRGRVSRALDWFAILGSVSADERADDEAAVAGWLEEAAMSI